MALNLATATALPIRTYTGADKEGVTRTRRPYNGHYLHQAAGMHPHPQSGDSSHNIRSLVMGNFSMWQADLKWSDLEPSEGVYDLGKIRAMLDVCTEHRIFGGLNFEWKHFSCKNYANVCPSWIVENSTNVVTFSFTGGGSLYSIDSGELCYVGASFATATATGVFCSADAFSATETTGTAVMNVISGTFANGNAVKRYSNGATICTISSVPASRTGTQVLMGQDGLHAKTWELYIANKIRKLYDEIYRQFGHHPWFAGIEGPETAGIAVKDSGSTTVTGGSYAHAGTYKWTGGTGTNGMLNSVDTAGNTFLPGDIGASGNGNVGKSNSLFYARLVRDYGMMFPSIVQIGSWNMLPGWSGAGGHKRGYDYMTAPDGVDVPVMNSICVGGPDILYEFPATGAPNKYVYPFCRVDLNGYGFEEDGAVYNASAGTSYGSPGYARFRHKFAMQHDSHKTAENGGLTLEKLWKWSRDYLNLHMIQWNYQTGTQGQYKFSDQKTVISGVGDNLLTASNPPDANGYSNRTAVTATLASYKAIGRKFTAAGTYPVNTTNGFPADGSGVQNSYSVSFRFQFAATATWTTQKTLWSSGRLSVVYKANGDIELRDGTTVICLCPNTGAAGTNFTNNTSAHYGTVNFSVGRHIATTGAVADRKCYLFVKNSAGNDEYCDAGAASAYLLGPDFSVCTAAGVSLHTGCSIIGRNLAGIPNDSNKGTRELKTYNPSKAIG